MCLSVPCRVVEIEGKWAEVEGAVVSELSTQKSDHFHKVYIGLLKDVRVGDYLMVHGDMAIHKVDSDDAMAMLSLA
jgi:hydrogenase assembly chaperone HypC/HupF